MYHRPFRHLHHGLGLNTVGHQRPEAVSLRATVTNIDASDHPAISPVMADRLLKLDQVKEIAGLSKTMIYRLIADGKFPAPFKPWCPGVALE